MCIDRKIMSLINSAHTVQCSYLYVAIYTHRPMVCLIPMIWMGWRLSLERSVSMNCPSVFSCWTVPATSSRTLGLIVPVVCRSGTNKPAIAIHPGENFCPKKKRRPALGGIRTHHALLPSQGLYTPTELPGTSAGRGWNLQHNTKANLKPCIHELVSSILTHPRDTVNICHVRMWNGLVTNSERSPINCESNGQF